MAQRRTIPAGLNAREQPTTPLKYENITVLLIKGSIADEDKEVDVIVSSTDSKLDLSKGESSKALLSKGGSRIQLDCWRTYPNGITPGEIAEIFAGNMECKQLYFVTLQKMDKKIEETLEGIVADCLEKAHNAKYSSISFTALGTGYIGYKKRDVARGMFSGVEKFSSKIKISSVKTVRFVLVPKDEDTYREFKEEYKHKQLQMMLSEVSVRPKMRSVKSRDVDSDDVEKKATWDYDENQQIATDGLKIPAFLDSYSIKKGRCLIINNKKFIEEERIRIGTEKDAEAVKKLFPKFGLEPVVKTDVVDILKEIKAEATNFTSAENKNKYDCFVCVILTHGGRGAVEGAKQNLTEIKDILTSIDEIGRELHGDKCKSLINKPKLFFIQACQGSDKMKGEFPPDDKEHEASKIQADSATPKDTNTKAGPKISVPDGADILIGYSTMPMFVSFRHKETGSYYIQTLCEVLEQHCDRYDLVTILTIVNSLVAQKNIGSTSNGDICKQMPCFTSSLRKLLYLKKQ